MLKNSFSISVFGQIPVSPSMPMGIGFALGGVELSANEYITLDNAVKFIIDPTASPSPTLLMLASQLGSVPNSAAKMMSFLIPLQAMARQRKLSVPGVPGQATESQINDYVLKKTLQWMQQRAMMGQMTENPDLMMRMQQGTRPGAVTATKKAPTATRNTPVVNTQYTAGTNFLPLLALGGFL